MTTKKADFQSAVVRVDLDAREKNVEVPLLLEMEFALERVHPSRKEGRPRFSKSRVEVYRAVRAAGEYCDTTVPELALMAGCSVRECQYALRDLEYLGWIKKLTDVSDSGGLTGRGAQKRGNIYTVTRPDWAWDGTHRKRLWSLAQRGGVGVHSMHPSMLEVLGVENSKPACAPKGFSEPPKGRGAQHAPVGGVHRAKTPPLINKGSTHKRGKSETQKLQWPEDAKGFLKAWTDAGHKFPPFPTQAALDAYHEIKLGAGGAAAAAKVAKNYLACKDEWLVQRRHPLATLRKQWPSFESRAEQPARPRKVVQADGVDILSKLEARR